MHSCPEELICHLSAVYPYTQLLKDVMQFFNDIKTYSNFFACSFACLVIIWDAAFKNLTFNYLLFVFFAIVSASISAVV